MRSIRLLQKNTIKKWEVEKFETSSDKWKLMLKVDFIPKKDDALEIGGNAVTFEMLSDKFENTRYNYMSSSPAAQVVLNEENPKKGGFDFKLTGGQSGKGFSISSGAVQLDYTNPDKSSIKRPTISIPTLEADLKATVAKTDVNKQKAVQDAIKQAVTKIYTKEFKLGDSLDALFNPINNVLVAAFNKNDSANTPK